MVHLRPRREVPLLLRAGAIALGATLLLSLAAEAAPGPVGEEYAINDRTLPPKAWWMSCTDAAGRGATLLNNCSGAGCDTPGDLFLQRYDAAGNTFGSPVRVNEGPAWRLGFRVVCSDDGWVAAQWVEAGCYRHRVFDPGNQPAGVAILAGDQDCRVRPNVAIDDDGSTMAVWPQWLPSQGSQILVRRFRADGEAGGDAVQVSEGTVGARVQPKVSIDETGVALVTWLGQNDGYDAHGPVFGRFVGADGLALGAAFRIDTFGYGENSDPAIRRLGDGTFEVAWNNPLEGGRVARQVHASGVWPLSASAAESPGPALPRFGAARIVDSYRESLGQGGEMVAGASATWMFSDATSRHWRSSDDSRTWSGPFAVNESSDRRETVGSNAAGTWMALKFEVDSTDIQLSRSTDDGANWSSLSSPLTGPKTGLVHDARVRGVGNTWVAAWSIHGGDEETNSVVLARSTDGGVTWNEPKAVFTGTARGRLGFDLATDGSGTWIVMLADEGIRFLRSQDDGKQWTAPPAVVSNAYCKSCAGLWRHTRVSLAGDGEGRWLAVFSAPLLDTGQYGRDGDVFVLSSDDDGQGWSQPHAVASHATSDGSPDFAPTIATNRSGKWLAAWISHHPVGAGDGLDSDVLVAVSTDFGVTWSPPALLGEEMEGDQAGDVHVTLAAGSGGRWLAGWQRTDFASASGLADDNLMVAAAEATCGNGLLEIGEACDDGQRIDDDGCDSNCTRSGCGNGIVNAGEECDDGNGDDADRCTTTCAAPRCGDGIVSPFESCDDGNDIDTDSCPNTCGAPGCGDGIVQQGIEECDSGGVSTAVCTPDCKLPRCGDGNVAPRLEACDDGNDIDDDACPNDCSRAVCGDGFTSLGWEECDPADPLYANACTADCRLVGLCGDANADAMVTAADARQVLKRSVGMDVDCPKDACDMDSNGRITVLDAHMDLRKAVGLEVGERCSIGTGSIVFWIEETRSLGAFQIEIDYSSTGGAFPGSGSQVACRSDLAGDLGDVDDPDDPATVLVAFNDVESYSVLTAGLVALQSFTGRVDLFRCDFEMPEERADAHFAIYVTDATDPDGTRLDPLPLVGYRVE
ncbi:MAG: DUF4215 domain-containing protein [Candidatus Binatia bacterium]